MEVIFLGTGTSQGVPMICHGDELGRTQLGNNNGYCQDNRTTWIDWENVDEDLLAFTRIVSGIRGEHPIDRDRTTQSTTLR